MLSYDEGERILQAIGLNQKEREKILQGNVRKLLEKILERLD